MRPAEGADYVQWAQLRSSSRAFLQPWEPTWPRDDLTRSAYRQRVRRYNKDMRDDYAYALFVFCRRSGQLVGGLTLSHVRRGVAQTCSLGYWVGQPYANQGYMSAAVNAATAFAFDSLRLHRIEAACLPVNEASRETAPAVRFFAGRLCPQIPENQRKMAGSPAVCTAGCRARRDDRPRRQDRNRWISIAIVINRHPSSAIVWPDRDGFLLFGPKAINLIVSKVLEQLYGFLCTCVALRWMYRW